MSSSSLPQLESPVELPSDRFDIELEFVQSLASPAYLHFLATQGYFQDAAFMAFLRYLKYWKKPEYARFLTYPHCLFFLDLLCRETDGDTFRRELSNVSFRNYLHEQQFYNWQYRSRHLYGEGLLLSTTAAADTRRNMDPTGDPPDSGTC
jgi:mediator of RNA polymerase II transcription subunit 31